MNAASSSPPNTVEAIPRALTIIREATPYAKVVLLYESFATAMRGKSFCDHLLADLGLHCDFDEALWRTDLLEAPAIRHEAARAAACADFVVLSLRGDGDLPAAVEKWCALWMRSARDRGVTFVAVFDPATAVRFPMENVQSHLRKAAFATGVQFFSHTVLPAGGKTSMPGMSPPELLELPVLRERFARRGAPPPVISRRRAKTILVVDDYPVLCDVVSRALEAAGYRTLVAHDGDEAQRILQNLASEVQLVVTDIEMPRMRGDELAVWIQHEHADLPVLFMSSILPRCEGAKELPLLDKPFRMDALVAAVAEIVGGAVLD